MRLSSQKLTKPGKLSKTSGMNLRYEQTHDSEMTGRKETLWNLRISIIIPLQINDMNRYEQDVGGSRKHQNM